MGKALDLMERAFESIIDNGELMLDEDFMINELFSDIAELLILSKHIVSICLRRN
jgi:hypothetical protein